MFSYNTNDSDFILGSSNIAVITSKSWKKAVPHLIWKLNGKKANIQQHCPIDLTSIYRKLFEKLLMEKVLLEMNSFGPA